MREEKVQSKGARATDDSKGRMMKRQVETGRMEKEEAKATAKRCGRSVTNCRAEME
jgi:hypothetical protein